MPIDFLCPLLAATGFCAVLMLVVWLLALRWNNLGIVDIAWSYAFSAVVMIYAAMAADNPARRWLIAGMVTVWSLRLGTHLLMRVSSHHPEEDVRYAQMREKWKSHFKLSVLLFFQMQAASIVLLSVPFLIICSNDSQGISLIEWVGAGFWLAALLGESVADWQLKQFKAASPNRGRVCRAGLWNYSRHPNYFFEWLVWVAYFIFALGSPFGCTTIYCPALMLFLLIRVTGIPLTEELAVKNKGDAYRNYQRTTSMFIPWFRKS